jgi:SAM-dependent methyltransferase
MDEQQQRPGEQSALWNGTGGRGWVALEDLIDQLFRPVDDLLVDAVLSEPSSRVLDVGCGAGSTTVAIARRLGGSGSCTGIDVSEPMVAAARERARRERATVDFVVADAQTHRFEPASFDTITSRFGVMFFGDPSEAFANLHRAATSGARLRLVVWRSPAENPFMTTAELAAAPLLPDLPARRPNEPGQFGFADGEHVRGILEASGWSELDLQRIDVPCTFPEAELVRYVSQLGPVGRILQQADDELRARVIAAVRPAFAPYVHGAEVAFTAACWMISARA